VGVTMQCEWVDFGILWLHCPRKGVQLPNPKVVGLSTKNEYNFSSIPQDFPK